MSLSAPSWSLIDTGQHLHIKGNVEFDRAMMHAYDCLNFSPFYAQQATRGSVDMPGTGVPNAVGVGLLLDAYDSYERVQGYQLYQRGPRLATLKNTGEEHFLKHPARLATEFVTGFEARNIVFDQTERELEAKLNDPRVRYLDLLAMSFDHTAHHNNDLDSHLEVLRELDALVGRVWTAIETSSMSADTALVIVSDHGFNTDERVIDQGFKL